MCDKYIGETLTLYQYMTFYIVFWSQSFSLNALGKELAETVQSLDHV